MLLNLLIRAIFDVDLIWIRFIFIIHCHEIVLFGQFANDVLSWNY